MEAWSLRRLSGRVNESNLPTGRTLNLIGGLALVAIAVSRRSPLLSAAFGLAGGGLLYQGATGRVPELFNRGAERLRQATAQIDSNSFGEDLDDEIDDIDAEEARSIVAEGLGESDLDGLTRGSGAREASLGLTEAIDLPTSLDLQESLDPDLRLDTSDPLDNAVRLEAGIDDLTSVDVESDFDDVARTTPLDFSEDADETDRLGTIRRG